jgi:hypothetical protein
MFKIPKTEFRFLDLPLKALASLPASFRQGVTGLSNKALAPIRLK